MALRVGRMRFCCWMMGNPVSRLRRCFTLMTTRCVAGTNNICPRAGMQWPMTVGKAGNRGCPLSSCQDTSAMARQPGTPGEVAFLASICPASQPNRTPLGRHAQFGHTQSALCNVQPVHRGDFRLLPHDTAKKMARVPRHRHRQLPRRITQGIQSDLRGKTSGQFRRGNIQ
jgi:hypothetical protein